MQITHVEIHLVSSNVLTGQILSIENLFMSKALAKIKRLRSKPIFICESIYELSRLFKRYVHGTVFILQFARKSYHVPSQPKNNDIRSALFFILS